MGLLLVTLTSGCGAEYEARQRVDESREALRTCLASTPNNCAAQTQMLAADQRTYEAATAGGSHGFNRFAPCKETNSHLVLHIACSTHAL
jgi:hypothetical protein